MTTSNTSSLGSLSIYIMSYLAGALLLVAGLALATRPSEQAMRAYLETLQNRH